MTAEYDETSDAKGSVTISFTYKTIWDHFCGYWERPLPVAGFAVAVFGALWTFGEAAIQFTGADPHGWGAYGLLLIASVVVAMAWNLFRYLRRIPEGLEEVSSQSQRIAHLQRPKWEVTFTQCVLAQLLSPIDRECRDLLDGKVFVLAEQRVDFRHYYAWLSGRSSNMLRLLGIAKRLLVEDFPRALTLNKDETVCPRAIVDASLAIQRVYQGCLEFERSSHSVIPHPECERLHELQIGWSQPVQHGIHQLFEFLQNVRDADIATAPNIQYEIDFGEVPNAEEYSAELDRLDSRIEQIAADDVW